MGVKSYLVSTLSLLICGVSCASQTSEPFHLISPSTSVFASINIEADWIQTGNSQTLSLISPFTNFYHGHSDYKASGGLGVGLGVEEKISDVLSLQLGAAAYFNTSVKNQGQVEEFSLPEFTNFNYNYQIQSSRVVATTKILSTFKSIVHPYVSGEIGGGFNRSYEYNETPLNLESVPMTPFQDKSKSSLAWSVGTGIEVDVHSHLRLGAGYQFADLGQALLGPSPAQCSSQALGSTHLYSHQLRIQLTALI